MMLLPLLNVVYGAVTEVTAVKTVTVVTDVTTAFDGVLDVVT